MPATVKTQNQVTTEFKTVADKHNRAKSVVTTEPRTSPLRVIYDLLDSLPLKHSWSWLFGYKNPSLPPHWGGPQSGVPENCHPVCGCIRQHALGRKIGEILALACRNVERLLGREVELENFLNQYAVDICLLIEIILNPIVSATAQDNSRWRYSHTGPPWCSPSISARSGAEPPSGTCRHTCENPYGLPFALPPSDWSENVRLFLPLAAGPVDRRPEH